MIISLYLKHRVIKCLLPTEVFGSYTFSDDDNNHIFNVEARDNKWCLYSTIESSVLNGNVIIDQAILVPNRFYYVKANNNVYILFVSDVNNNSMLPYSYDSALDFNISDSGNISYSCPLLKNVKFSVKVFQEKIEINKPLNVPIYIDGINKMEEKVDVRLGSTIEIYGFKLVILKNMVLISDNPSVKVDAVSTKLIRIDVPVTNELKNDEILNNSLYKKEDYFSKSARLYRQIQPKKIQLVSPPKINDGSNSMPLLLTIGPMLTMAISSMVSLWNIVSQITSGTTSIKTAWPTLLTTCLMMVSSLLWPILTRRYQKKLLKQNNKRVLDKYSKYLVEKEKELEKEAKEEKEIILENLYSLDNCVDIIARKNVTFWSKRNDASDFLTVRIGVGNQELQAGLEYPKDGFSLDENELKKKTDAIAEKYHYIENVPVSYSLKNNRITAVMGDREGSCAFVNNLILQLITFYSYEDLKIVLFTDQGNVDKWDYIKYLPHNFDNNKKFRFFATSNEDAKNVIEYLSYELGSRKQYAGSENFIPQPHYLVIVDGYNQVKRLNGAKDLFESEGNLGFSYLIVENRLSNLPSKCRDFLMLDGEKSVVLKSSYMNQQPFSTEIRTDIDMLKIAKSLANVPIEFQNAVNGGNLPESIAFLEMEDVGKVEQLNILARWNNNDSTQSLKAEVGVGENGDLMYLDLHEKQHGPHGLVAGMTGSGKSEFIITYILSMCMNYSPDDVSFILIDYKGGGLAGAFENKTNNIVLPHLAGTITNLDKAEMDRTLVSIDSEVKRRQRVFNEARDMLGESTIDIYKYQRFYKEGKITEPVPHLFIICDEFAELKSQQPDFMDNLISVARIGRSLGVHLILATQKPSGVVDDQIWSNTKFRVCLKVQDEADSREMLKRPEAASLKQTGRFYLQVGFDEYFALGQSAWCGAKYYPSDAIIKTEDKSLNFINNYGRFIKNIQGSTGNNKKGVAQGEQISAIIKNIIEVSNKVNKKARRLWLDNIPETIILDNLYQKYNFAPNNLDIKVIIGEYDAPEKQEQGVVTYDYLTDGNTIIYGTDASENENLLNTMLYSTTRYYPSDVINFYIVDFGSESLKRYSKLPHVGGIVLNGEDEKFNNLLKLIKEETKKRKKLLSSFGGDFDYYNKNNQNKLPVFVVIMNNYSTIYETYDNLYDELPELVRDSERYGIVFILTGNGPMSINSRISQNFKTSFAFKQKESSDYSTIFNNRIKLSPRELFGRGLCEIDGVHEFQTASIVENRDTLNDYLIGFVNSFNGISAKRATLVPTLPDRIDLNMILPHLKSLKEFPVGISKKDLIFDNFDLTQNIGSVISSTRIENMTNYAKSLADILPKIGSTNLIVFDSTHALNLSVSTIPNYVTDNFDSFMDNLVTYLNNLTNTKSPINNVIMIYNFSKFYLKASHEKFDALVDAIKKNEKAYILLFDVPNKFKNFQYEPWFQELFDLSNGIWIGLGISDQQLIRLSKITKDMTKIYKNDMGYVINDGNADLIKMNDFYTTEASE